jgi:hypothetical protein
LDSDAESREINENRPNYVNKYKKFKQKFVERKKLGDKHITKKDCCINGKDS